MNRITYAIFATGLLASVVAGGYGWLKSVTWERQQQAAVATEIAIAQVSEVERAANRGEITHDQEVVKARAVIESVQYGKDGYLFAYDHGTVMAHGKSPAFVGKNLIDKHDDEGHYMIRDLHRVADDGTHWTTFGWKNTGEVVERVKVGYAANTQGNLGWMVGSGIYIDNIAEDWVSVEELEFFGLLGLFLLYSPLVFFGGKSKEKEDI